jgi:hypothetical protein
MAVHIMLNFDAKALPRADIKFFFIFTPNNSGSTILSQYIQSQMGGYLPPFGNNEGQIIPEVRPMMRVNAWDSDHAFDWRFIRTEWEKHAAGQTFIEGSPPDIMRYKAIAEVFGRDSTALINIASPYMRIASCLRRYNRPGTSVKPMTRHWMRLARAVQSLRQDFAHFPFIRYEDFVTDPLLVNRLLDLPPQEFLGDGKRGSQGSGVIDMRGRTTLFLTEEEIDTVTALLERERDLVEGFGYKLQSGKELIAELSALNPAEYDMAQERRVEWNAGRKRRKRAK